ncbi:MAG: NAD-dependent epimerase/dehydratase family protein [Dongiaceae bacterium]
MPRTVAVTGATGFVGSHIVGQLSRAGWQVRILTRRLPVNPRFGDAAIEAVIGALEDRHALARLVRDVDAVVHAAGKIKARSHAEFFAANATGTRLLVEAAIATGNRPRFVLISSLAARRPQISDYAASKLAGEAELTRLDGDLPWSILRPPAVYGPGDRETLAFFRALRLGFALLPPARDARLSLLHAADLATAAAAALEPAAAVAGTFEIDDGHPAGYGWDELVRTAARHLEVRPVRLRIPGPLLQAAAQANAAIHRLTDRTAMLTPGKAREMLHRDWTVRDGTYTAATNWRPAVDLDKGFAETIAWYRRHRWL